MKTFRLPIVFMFMVLAVAQIAQAQSPWGDLLNEKWGQSLYSELCCKDFVSYSQFKV
jgi:hypothetical protein